MTNPQVTDEMVEKALDAWLASPSEDTLASIRAALTAALADHVVGWRTMDSAPKDGTEILVAGINSGKQFYRAIVKWDGAWMLFDPMMDDYTAESSGHKWWSPLPAAPLPQKEG